MPNQNGPTAGDIPSDAIHHQLARMAASNCFRRANLCLRFLNHLTGTALQGRSSELKEYAIGLAIVDRPSDYDPRTNPIVRLEARRLRLKLAEYYQTEGQDDSIVIDLPKGGYVPQFRFRTPPSLPPLAQPSPLVVQAAKPWPGWWIGTAAFALLVVVGVMAWSMRRTYSAGAASVPDGSAAQSLVVLPFENRTGRAEDQSVADRLTEELTDQFVRIPELRVIAQTSAKLAAARNQDLRKIGADLNVAAAVTGTAENWNGQLRIRAVLTSTHDGRLLWTETMTIANPRDMAAFRQRVFEGVARQVHFSTPAPPSSESGNPDAQQRYIQAKYLWSRRDPDSVRQSVALFQQAVLMDPSYTAAYTGLADAYAVIASNEIGPAAENLAKAKTAALKAISLDPNSAAAHASLGLIHNAQWDWQGAAGELRRALKLNRGFSVAYVRLAVGETLHGRFDQADSLLRQAQALDPLNWMITYCLGENAYYAKRYDETITQAKRIEPYALGAASNLLYRAYLQKGLYAEARAAIERNDDRLGNRRELLLALTAPDSAVRNRDFRRIAARASPDTGPFFLAWTAAQAHATDLALFWLENACDVRDADLPSLGVEPAMDTVRSDPRYREILRKVGLAN